MRQYSTSGLASMDIYSPPDHVFYVLSDQVIVQKYPYLTTGLDGHVEMVSLS